VNAERLEENENENGQMHLRKGGNTIQKNQACGEQIAMLHSRELLERNSRETHQGDTFS
jgi:hypothetical protein